MDKNAIKKYAIWARRELIARVSQKAAQLEIEDGKTLDRNAETVNGVVLTPTQKSQRTALIDRINAHGYEQVMEEVAYTWFNRFCALRLMEVNNFLPTRVRIFTNEENEFKPQILDEAIHLELDGLDIQKVYDFKENNDNEGLYKYLIITECNSLGKILPGMFEKISNYTELLFPDNILREGSVIERLIAEIPEDNFLVDSENGQIEIIGWLYQYYISEKHDEIINIYKGTVKKDDIPAATQLFTTDWVVRYLIDNSVGKYWIERNPDSKLAEKLQYFVTPKNNEIKYIDDKITPEELTVLDPCMGSGHFLVYAFEVLMNIYDECGYSQRDAVRNIIENNLVGFDIDDRASQLAYFSVMMTACRYDSRLLKRKDAEGNPDIPQPQVYSIQESADIDKFAISDFVGDNAEIKESLDKILRGLDNAKEIGSLCLFEDGINYELLYNRFDELYDEITIHRNYFFETLLPFIKTAELLSKKYAVVATNPPYMNKYSNDLKAFINSNFKDYSGDLFSVFMYHNFSFCRRGGYSAFMTPFVWMFIKTYEKLREFIINNKSITSLIQMEYSAFEEATVPICSFVLKNCEPVENALCFRLSDFKGGMNVQREKVLEALSNKECGYFFETDIKKFYDIPGAPIAYWLSDNAFKAYSLSTLKDIAITKQGFKTGNNDLFLRFWYEIDKSAFSIFDGIKWYPCNKGGDYRRWYGNLAYVVDWENDGYKLINYKDEKGKQLSRPQNIQYNFTEGITWTYISSSIISLRYSPDFMMFESAGPMCFPTNENTNNLLGYLNSCVAQYFLFALEPTIRYSEGTLLRLPYIKPNDEIVEQEAKNCINICKEDWDSFEISWDFRKHPLVPSPREWAEQLNSQFADTRKEKFSQLAWHYKQWEYYSESRFDRLKENEEELNRIFIDIYGLQDELTPEVEDKDVTVRKADLQRDIKSLISYAVGCMFGRYSPYQEGLVYAGGNWDYSKYESLISESERNLHGFEHTKPVHYLPDADNIIPICDDDYFEDDIVGKFVNFIETIYGEETLEENLQFIADALGGNGKNARVVIRNYFLNDFYADHCKIYQKRPIYWLFDSGKKNGFKALVYMHRYREDTIARMRTDYVHEQQSRYRTAIEDAENRLLSAEGSERVKISKALGKLKDQDEEIRAYEEKIHHLADQMIRIDLDDGVKNNYEIFKDVLAKIK